MKFAYGTMKLALVIERIYLRILIFLRTFELTTHLPEENKVLEHRQTHIYAVCESVAEE
jgi:hypothetical protein